MLVSWHSKSRAGLTTLSALALSPLCRHESLALLQLASLELSSSADMVQSPVFRLGRLKRAATASLSCSQPRVASCVVTALKALLEEMPELTVPGSSCVL